jgi:hypothetical protein
MAAVQHGERPAATDAAATPPSAPSDSLKMLEENEWTSSVGGSFMSHRVVCIIKGLQ